MRTLTGPRHVSHVVGKVDHLRGPALVFAPSWSEAVSDAVFLKELLSTEEATRRVVRKIIHVAGSTYELIYKKDHRVECFSITEGSTISRPIGLTVSGPRVSMLHFYRPLHESDWRMLKLDEDVIIKKPAKVLVAA